MRTGHGRSCCIDHFKFYDCYGLDNIFGYTQNPQVLDTIYYAYDPVIRALLRAFAISILRAKPPSDWIEDGYAASFQDVDGALVCVQTIEATRRLHELVQVAMEVSH